MKQLDLNTKSTTDAQLLQVFNAMGIVLAEDGQSHHKISTENGDIHVRPYSSATYPRNIDRIEGVELRVRTASYKDICRRVHTKVQHPDGGYQVVIDLDRIAAKIAELTAMMAGVKKDFEVAVKKAAILKGRGDKIDSWRLEGRIPDDATVARTYNADSNVWVSISVTVDEKQALRILEFLKDPSAWTPVCTA